MMVLLLSCIELGFGQGCNYANPSPPVFDGVCYSSGGSVRSVFLTSYCTVTGTGRISNNGTLIEDMTIYFGGNLIIDQHTTFRRCTLLFENGKGINYTPHWSSSSGNPITSGVKFDNCYLGSCGSGKWKGIYGAFNHFNGSYVTIENNTLISNAEIGLNINYNSGDFVLISSTFEHCNEGIRVFGNLGIGPDRLSVQNCTFNDLNIGIRAHNYRRRLQITSINTFQNCDVAIWADALGGAWIWKQIINSCSEGIKISNTTSGASSPVIWLTSNNINALTNGIKIFDHNVPGGFIIDKNTLTGMNNARSSGINIENSRLINGITIANSPMINGFANGVRINKVSHKNFSLIASNISWTNSSISYTNNKISDIFKISSNSNLSHNGTANLHNIGSKGLISTLNAFDSPISFTNATEPVFDSNNFEWSNSITGSNGVLKLSSSSASSFCCNTFSGEGNNLYLQGTNINTKLKGSTFTNGKMIFDNTMVGRNEHAGNRWKGSSTGKLIGGLPSDNEFIVNYSESNANSGDIKPQNFQPSSIGPDWFRDLMGTSLGCIPNCKIDNPLRPEDDIFLLPDTTNLLGDCYPVALDLDGDGICDSSDPDPHDPCVPNFVDTDGDGICDSLDPDPLDACVPVFRDTDNDGICDSADPDPYDPCIPNGLDTDGDGICDIADPDPINPDPFNPVSHNDCWWLTDINGDRLWSMGYHQFGLKYSIKDLEWIAVHFTGTELGGYGSLHYVEAMSFLYEVLHTSPYYRVVSQILNDKYMELCDNYSSISQFVKVAQDIKAVDKFSYQREFNYTQKQVYLNKLEFLSNKLTVNNPVDSVHFLYVNEVLDLVRAQMEGILEVHETDRESKLTQLTSDINNLSEDFPVYNALKDFYIIYDEHVLRGNPLTNDQITVLTEMSKLCPLIFGEAVHHARAMLVGEEINEFSDFDDSCINTTWNTKKENTLAPNHIVVSPNPSYDWLRLTSKYKLVKVDIQNTLGAVLVSKIINDTDTCLNISNLPSAIYYIIVYTEDGNSVTKKIVKL